MSDKMTPIKLNQLKKASEAYAELRTLHTDPLTDEVDGTFPAWSIFRDDFIADWTSNRIIVDEKEADAMFDTIVEKAIQEIETAEAGATAVETEPTAAPIATTAPEAVVTAKRRGRPPGSAKAVDATAPKKSYYIPVSQRKGTKATKAKTAKVTKTKKVAAKKKSAGGGKMDLARVTVEKFTAKGWSRKDIIARLVDVNGLSPAYAATAYQKLK